MKVTYNYTKKNKETRTIVTDDTKKISALNIAPTHCVVYDIESHGWKTLIKANINKNLYFIPKILKNITAIAIELDA